MVTELVMGCGVISFFRQLACGKQIDDLAVMDGYRVVFEDFVLWDNGDYPAGRDKRINGCSHVGSGQKLWARLYMESAVL